MIPFCPFVAIPWCFRRLYHSELVGFVFTKKTFGLSQAPIPGLGSKPSKIWVVCVEVFKFVFWCTMHWYVFHSYYVFARFAHWLGGDGCWMNSFLLLMIAVLVGRMARTFSARRRDHSDFNCSSSSGVSQAFCYGNRLCCGWLRSSALLGNTRDGKTTSR